MYKSCYVGNNQHLNYVFMTNVGWRGAGNKQLASYASKYIILLRLRHNASNASICIQMHPFASVLNRKQTICLGIAWVFLGFRLGFTLKKASKTQGMPNVGTGDVQDYCLRVSLQLLIKFKLTQHRIWPDMWLTRFDIGLFPV